MKVVRVKKVTGIGHTGFGIYSVFYTIKTEGNRHFTHDFEATDEMQAYVKGLEFAQKDEIEVLENKIDDLDFIKTKMPNAEVDKQLKKLRKLLTDVHKSGGNDATTK